MIPFPPHYIFGNETPTAFILRKHRNLPIKAFTHRSYKQGFSSPTVDAALLHIHDKTILPSVGLCFKYFELGIITTNFLVEQQLGFHNYTIMNI